MRLKQLQLDTIENAALALVDIALEYRNAKDKDKRWVLKVEQLKLTNLIRQTLNNLED